MGRAKDKDKDGSDGGQAWARGVVKGKKVKKEDDDPLKSLADKIRNHKDLESRWAVLRERRIEYFREKDFANFASWHPEILEAAVEAMKNVKEVSLNSAQSPEEQVITLLLKKQLIIRCDRVNKAPRPGKKRLSSWPKRLDVHVDQSFTEDDGFYAWTYDRSTTIVQTMMSCLVPVLTIGICLFPVFPYWFKLGVLYVCLTFLGFIFSLLALRGLAFGVFWVLLGKRIWFFPNILAEEATFVELCRFLPDGKKDEDQTPKWTERLAVALFVAGTLWLFVHHAPDEASRAKYSRKAKDKLQEWLEWNPSIGMLTGGEKGVKIVDEGGVGSNGHGGGGGGEGGEMSGDVSEASIERSNRSDNDGVIHASNGTAYEAQTMEDEEEEEEVPSPSVEGL